jgi:hypothetical protein
LKPLTTISLILFSVLLVGCFGLWDSGSQRIIGKYIVVWIDVPQNQGIAEEFEMNSPSSSLVVPEYVFAVGHNDDYIIAKQHPTSGFEHGYEIDTTSTNYYVVDMNRRDSKTGNKVFGPLTLSKFDSLTTKLKIRSIKFDQTYLEKI